MKIDGTVPARVAESRGRIGGGGYWHEPQVEGIIGGTVNSTTAINGHTLYATAKPGLNPLD
jgi:hypothetical protein